MIQKKVCLLGPFAVGKTSLITRFVHSIFSERYLTTVGVKIDKKRVAVEGRTVTLVIWDLHGDDEYQRVRMSYLRGASGFFLVVDGTRRPTLDQALGLQRSARAALGDTPFMLLLNKQDLSEEWEIKPEDVEELKRRGWSVLQTSAKTGEAVEAAFLSLTLIMLKRDQQRQPR